MAVSASPPPELDRRPGMAGPRRSALALALILLGGCAGIDDDTWNEPRRPELDIARDAVDPTPGQVAGSWTCHELDPLPGQAPVLTDLRLDPGGSFEWQQRIVLGEAPPASFERVLVLEGKWRLEDGQLVRSAVTGSSRPADGSAPDGPAPSMDGILAALARAAESVPTELLRVGVGELVMRDAEAGAATLACRRLGP